MQSIEGRIHKIQTMKKSNKITANQIKAFIFNKMKFYPDLQGIKMSSVSVVSLKKMYFDKYKKDAVLDYKINIKVEKEALKILNSVDRKKGLRAEYYKSQEWSYLRNKVFARDDNKCTECGDNKNLQCHHRFYLGERVAWDYPLSCFKTLCTICHNKLHKSINIKTLVFKNIQLLPNKEDIDDVIFYDATKPNLDKFYEKRDKIIKSDKYIKSLPILNLRDKALQYRYDQLRKNN